MMSPSLPFDFANGRLLIIQATYGYERCAKILPNPIHLKSYL